MSFTKGQRVRMTAEAIRNGLDISRYGKRITTGTVVGYFPGWVRVLRDGIKNPNAYAEHFWEPLPTADSTSGPPAR